ncbi:MAG: hypothetical protein H7842_02430 [Gammaproteobacteria bacterium SHHR-1]
MSMITPPKDYAERIRELEHELEQSQQWTAIELCAMAVAIIALAGIAWVISQ